MRTSCIQKNKGSAGFTLVEALVAISIFSMSLLGLMTVLSSGIADTGYAKQKVTAAYLSQEGVEYIRNMRDTFVLYNTTSGQAGWNNFLAKLASGSCDKAGGCYIDPANLFSSSSSMPMTEVTLAACSDSCPPLLFNSATGTYGYSAGTASGFTRTLSVTSISLNEIRVSSTVSWSQRSGNYSVKFSEELFNWVQ